MIGRRNVLQLAGVAFLNPLAAKAQVAGKTYRIAVLSPARFPADEIRRVVLPELARRGFKEGHNLVVTEHVGPLADLARLAAEALAQRPDLVIVSTNPAVWAILDRSKTVPIVMAFAGEDPVATGIAKSLARPGGSVTGLTTQATAFDAKRVALLHEAVPSARRIGILAASPSRHIESIREMKAYASSLGLETIVVHAAGADHYQAAFSALRSAKADAVVTLAAPEYLSDGAVIAKHALAAGLPAIGEFAVLAQHGYLMGYGTNFTVFRRRAADFIERILRGALPGDLPIEQPTTVELVVNLKTAKALGLTIPPSILVRADEVIE